MNEWQNAWHAWMHINPAFLTLLSPARRKAFRRVAMCMRSSQLQIASAVLSTPLSVTLDFVPDYLWPAQLALTCSWYPSTLTLSWTRTTFLPATSFPYLLSYYWLWPEPQPYFCLHYCTWSDCQLPTRLPDFTPVLSICATGHYRQLAVS